MKDMEGITVAAVGGPTIVHRRPRPTLRPGYLLVKTIAVALNPADALAIDYKHAMPGALMGSDYSGVVVEVGENVQRSFAKGDRVCGMTRAADKVQYENGTFAEYIVVKADLQLHIPESMSFEDAASFGVTTVTTGRYFFDKFGVPYPELAADGTVNTSSYSKQQIFIYGGSTAMGTMAIQWAKLANFFVITTSSIANMEFVKSYGPDVVLDHYSDSAPAELSAIAKGNEAEFGKLTLCLDNISRPASAAFCAKALLPDGPPADGRVIRYSTILPFTPEMEGIETYRTIGYSFLGEEWEQFGQVNPASKEDFEAAKKFAMLAEKLMALGIIRAHRVEIRKGGLRAIATEGTDLMRPGNVSGRKLVYPISIADG